jgi:hypothetical protein
VAAAPNPAAAQIRGLSGGDVFAGAVTPSAASTFVAATTTIGVVGLEVTTVAWTPVVVGAAVGIGSASVVVADGSDVETSSDVVDVEVDVVSTAVVLVDSAGGAPPRTAWTSPVNDVVTMSNRASPGQDVLLIVLCPVMVGVVTVAPNGHRLDPPDVKLTCEPGEVAIPCLSANQASSAVSDVNEAGDGSVALKSPIKHTSWL